MLVRITMSGTYTELGVKAQNVIHMLNIDGQLSLSQIEGDIRLNWIGALRPLQSNVWRWDWVNVRNLDDLNQISHQTEYAPGLLGNTSFNTNSPVLTPIVTLQTNRIGRTGRGRIYIPGVGTNMVSRTRVSTTMAQNWITAAGIMSRYLSGPSGQGPLTLVVRGKNPQANGTPHVTSFILRSILGTQRRRNELVGF